MTTGLLGGTFDPPQTGHVALGRAALEELPIDRLVVLVAATPGHRAVVAPAEARLRLARLAFPFADEVVLDEHAFTVDAVAGGRFGNAIFIVGADEGADFPTWKEPDEVLRWVRLAVGTRSGYPPPDLDRYGDRVLSFRLESPPVSSSEIRARIARGEPVDELLPPAVTDAIAGLGLYRGYTEPRTREDLKRP
ncbi:MAG TPA: nicotinate-nicotinamide nucleotide adenylyltransferase [Gaiellaceae bacterium]|nr:nicotinate-nicotinamide nucleotide adenylyltransferase [Gaiellaceae bacterium]